MAKRILVVDDQREIRAPLREFLQGRGHEVVEADTARAARAAFLAARPDAVLLDYELPDANALEVIPRLRELDDGVPIVVVTGHATIELAVQAMREGAEYFLTKPVQLATLAVVLERIFEHSKNRRARLASRSRDSRAAADPFIGVSDSIRSLRGEVEKIARSDRPVLIHGETGAGKGVLAAWIHRHGPRAEEAFVDLNCAGLSRELLESELFGHEKGAFTGAVAAKSGLIEVAHQGTFFLDEIGDMDLPIQPKLLKVLDDRQFRRLGSVHDRAVDVRLIAATHQDLAEAVQAQKFRSDLYFRISTLQIRIPSLRQRPQDIVLLAQAILRSFAAELGREMELSADAVETLTRYPWPGNIRELRNVLERSVLLAETPRLGAKDLRFDPAALLARTRRDEAEGHTLDEQEKRHIEESLRAVSWRVNEAAKRLGLSRSALYRKIKEYQLRRP
jgi:DNA-binding NtrC family response regulator